MFPPNLDLVIVGGGPAGLTTAAALVRADPTALRRVIVLEKARYPREKICAGAVGDRGWRFLEDLDVAPQVPHVRVHGISVSSREGHHIVKPGDLGRVVRRIELDAALRDQVASLGVQIHDGVRVTSLQDNGDHVCVETTAGPLRAAAVVGADGVGSMVRRSLGLHAGALRAMALEVDTEPTPADLPRDTIHFDAEDRRYAGYIWDFPSIVDGEAVMCRGVYVLRPKTGTVADVPPDDGVDLEAALATYLDARGLSLSNVRKKRFAERGYVIRDQVVGGRRMLVGEAAGIDPISGEGIAQALEYGARAGRFLARWDGTTAGLSRWQQVFGRSRLGWDLFARSQGVSWFYGRRRPRLERGFAHARPLLHAAALHWAGRGPDIPRIALGLGAATLGALQSAPSTPNPSPNLPR